MKWTKLLPISLFVIVVAGAIIPPTAFSSGERTYITALTGNVQIKRRFWWGYRQADLNETLWREDKLWIRDTQSSATVICNSDPQQRWTVPRRQDVPVTEGCPNTSYRPEDNLAPGRDPKNENLPYLIRSRNSALFLDEPLRLSWNPVDGATHYDVEIRYLARTILKERFLDTAAEFQDLSDLRNDRDYFVIVTASTGISAPESPNLDPAPIISFLNDEQAREVRRRIAEIESWQEAKEAKVFAIADLYRNYGLYQSAIDVLKAAIEDGTGNVSIHQLQSEIYLEVGLETAARESYLNALRVAETEGNLAYQANFQEQLGKISYYLEDYREAITWLSSAIDSYQDLLDVSVPENQEKLSDLEELILDSQNRIPTP